MHCRPFLAAAAIVAASTPDVHAEDNDRSEQRLQAVEVTGSRLRRTDAETMAPVQTIGREEIVRSGAVSLSEVLHKLPANNKGAFNEGNTVDGYGAAAIRCAGSGPARRSSSSMAGASRRSASPATRPSSTSTRSRSPRSSASRCCSTALRRSTARMRSPASST
jgi:hypothetical protein